MTPARRVRALSIHASYRCRHSGACCTSGWAIPVEPEIEDRLRRAQRSGSLRLPDRGDRAVATTAPEGFPVTLRSVAGLPHGARAVLQTDPAGRCVFFDAGGGRSGACTVHRDLGEGALPSACRHFPRVVTLTPLGVSVTLSHYCPTAASLLFGPLDGSAGRANARDPALRIVDDPPAFPAEWPYEGLDARDALPPLLRPGVLMDWPSLERWERFAVSVLAEEGPPEAALDVLSAAAEEARRWTPQRQAFGGFFEGVLGTAVAGGSQGEPALHGALRDGPRSPRDSASRGSRGVRAWKRVADCIPSGAPPPAAPEGLDEADERWVVPAWPGFSVPIRRWLAAKAFASWTALQGEGLRTTVAFLDAALGVLRIEAARGSASTARVLDADQLLAAVRRADLLLLHLADPEALAGRLSRCEGASLAP